METQVLNSTEYRNLPLSLLNVSKTNPRRTFDEIALKELAAFVPRIVLLPRRPEVA
jgi:ParB family chromosome partitioning protein